MRNRGNIFNNRWADLRGFTQLRRGDFRYTTILLLAFSYIKFVRASGEAILGTQRYFY